MTRALEGLADELLVLAEAVVPIGGIDTLVDLERRARNGGDDVALLVEERADVMRILSSSKCVED